MKGRNFDYGTQMSDTNEGEMAKRALLTMAKDLYNLYISLNDGDDLPEWCHYKLATSRKDLSDITDYLTSKVMKRCLDSNMTPDKLRLEIRKSMSDSLLEEGFFSDTFKTLKNKFSNNKVITREEVFSEINKNKFRYTDIHILRFLNYSKKIIENLYNSKSRNSEDDYIKNSEDDYIKKGNKPNADFAKTVVKSHYTLLKKLKSTLENLNENHLANPNFAANFISRLNTKLYSNNIERTLSGFAIYFLQNSGIKKSEDHISRILFKVFNYNSKQKKSKTAEDNRRKIVNFKNEILPHVRAYFIKEINDQIELIEYCLDEILSMKYALDIVYKNRDKISLDSSMKNPGFFASPQDEFKTDIASKYIAKTGPKSYERYRKD